MWKIGRRFTTSNASTSSDPGALPAAIVELARHALPVRITRIDVEAPIPEMYADAHYCEAWAIIYEGGTPRGIAVIDLAADQTEIRNDIQRHVARIQKSAATEIPGVPTSVESLPRISVVIPSIISRIEDLDRCLETIGQLDYPDFEVILVDNRRAIPADDQLLSLIARRPWLRVVRQVVPGISAARNAGVGNANGEVIAFTDDDVRVEPQWLRAIGTRFARNPALDAVTGLVLPAELESPSQVWFERYYGGFNGTRAFTSLTLEPDRRSKGLLRGGEVVVRNASGMEIRHFAVYGVGAYAAGANMAFRKSALARIGGFDLALGTGTPARGGEDLASMIKVLWTGGSIGYEPGAVVHHRHRVGYDELLSQMDGNGLGFTAMLTSLVRSDPRHILVLASKLPRALKSKAVQGLERINNKAVATASEPSFPGELARREFRAYARGPMAYARSRALIRRKSAASPLRRRRSLFSRRNSRARGRRFPSGARFSLADGLACR